MKRIILIISCFINVIGLANAHVVLETRFTNESFEPGDAITITWYILVDHDQIDWGLYFSKDGGDTWEPIEEGLPIYQLSYNWDAPYIESSKMLIQIVQNNDVTEDYFDKSDTFSIHSDNVTPVLDLKKSDLKLTVGPNPVADHAQIFIQSAMTEVRMRVYNIFGQGVAELGTFGTVHPDQTFRWETKDLRSGLYFLEVKGDNRIKIFPIVVSH